MSDLVVSRACGPRRKWHAVCTLSLLGCILDQEIVLCAKEVRQARHPSFWAVLRRSERRNHSYCSFGPIGVLHVFLQIDFVACPTVPQTLGCWPQGTSVFAGAKVSQRFSSTKSRRLVWQQLQGLHHSQSFSKVFRDFQPRKNHKFRNPRSQAAGVPNQKEPPYVDKARTAKIS